jgi:hypothetical protein
MSVRKIRHRINEALGMILHKNEYYFIECFDSGTMGTNCTSGANAKEQQKKIVYIQHDF